MANSELVNVVKAFFDKQEWKYDYFEQEGLFQSAVALTEDTSAMIHVIVGSSAYTVMVAPILNAAPQDADEIRNFINEINARVLLGGLVFDASEGVLYFRVGQICAGQLPSAETVQDSFMYPIDFVDENYALFEQVFAGTLTAADALNTMFSDGE